ncbi:hypothetical protein FCJ59_06580 [Cupriavidus basilensis]|nr:hypothetical protein [Cupriavidus basilensis]
MGRRESALEWSEDEKAIVLAFGLVIDACYRGGDAHSSEPSYDGLSVGAFNYTPCNLSRRVEA